MSISLKYYFNQIRCNDHLEIKNNFIIIQNDSLDKKYNNIFDINEGGGHIKFLFGVGQVKFNQYITLINFYKYNEMLDFISEELTSNDLHEGEDFYFDANPCIESFSKTGSLPDQPDWLISRLKFSNIDDEKFPEAVIINHYKVKSTKKCRRKFISKSYSQKVAEFNHFYSKRNYSKALRTLLERVGLKHPSS